MRARVVFDDGVALEVSAIEVHLFNRARALEGRARVGALRLGLGWHGLCLRVSGVDVVCDVDRDSVPAPRPARPNGAETAICHGEI